jgi:hypothetical protein
MIIEEMEKPQATISKDRTNAIGIPTSDGEEIKIDIGDDFKCSNVKPVRKKKNK